MLRARPLIPVLLVLMLATTLTAQRRQGGDRSIPFPGVSRDTRLEVQLTDTQGRPLRIQALVELMSIGGVNMRGYTDLDGRLSFSVLQGASYRVTISGSEIENETTTFEVLPGETFHREHFPVRIKQQPGQTPGGMVSAAALNVPEKARREFDKGIKEFHEKRWEKAREYFQKAVEEYPEFDWAYNNIGVTLIQEGDTTRARDAFTKALEINDRNPAAARNLGRIYVMQDKNFTGAKELLQKSLAVEPQNGETLTLLAYTQLQTGDFDSALANARKVHNDDSRDQFPFAHLIAGRVLERNGDTSGAASEYRTYLKEAEGSPAAQTAKDGLARLGAKPE